MDRPTAACHMTAAYMAITVHDIAGLLFEPVASLAPHVVTVQGGLHRWYLLFEGERVL